MKINDEQEVPIVEIDLDKDTPEDLNNGIRYTMELVRGSTAYSNDRNREYNGQPHTDYGIRGKTEIKGLTMRDVADCIIQGMLASSDNTKLQHSTFEIHKDLPEEYWHNGTWRYNDVYEIDWDYIDPIAIVQNTMCFIEHYMGIFPNVPKLENNKDK